MYKYMIDNDMNKQDVTLDQWNNPIWAVKTTQIPYTLYLFGTQTEHDP
jgi:hypothetical protein